MNMRTVDNGMPAIVSIQNTSYCNLSCLVCMHSAAYPVGSRSHMQDEVWSKIVENLTDYTGEIRFDIMGEPFADPKFQARLRTLFERAKGLIIITTNGTLISDTVIGKLSPFRSRLYITVSMLSGYPGEYKRITGRNLDDTIEVVNKLYASGIHTLISLAYYAEDGPYTGYIMDRVPRDVHVVAHPIYLPSSPFVPGVGQCHMPFENVFIKVDGSYVISCGDWMSFSTMGNIMDISIRAMFNSDTYHEARTAITCGKFPKICEQLRLFDGCAGSKQYKWYVANVNYSCAISLTETILIRRALESQGMATVGDPSDADIIVLHPCTMDAKGSYDKLTQLKEVASKTGAAFKIVGCFTKAYKAFVPGVEAYYSSEIPRLIGQELPNVPISMRQPLTMLLEQCRPDDIALIERQFGSCVAVRIGTGCSNDCSYCPIKLSRPTCLSVPHDRVIAAIKSACTIDADTICLICDDAGSYNDSAIDIDGLLNKVAPIVLSARRTLSIYYLYPARALEISNTLLSMARSGILFSLGIPIQHTNPRVLVEMNRLYDPCLVLSLVKDIVAAGTSVIANVIYDHPGETWEEFIEMAGTMVSSAYSKVVWFSYTPYQETRAFEKYNGDAFIDRKLRKRKTDYLYALRDSLPVGRFDVGTAYYGGFGTHVT